MTAEKRGQDEVFARKITRGYQFMDYQPWMNILNIPYFGLLTIAIQLSSLGLTTNYDNLKHLKTTATATVTLRNPVDTSSFIWNIPTYTWDYMGYIYIYVYIYIYT